MLPYSNTIYYTIILTLFFHRLAIASTFTPSRSVSINNVNITYPDKIGWNPVPQENKDEVSQEEEEEDDNDDEDDEKNNQNDDENNDESNDFEEKNCTCSGVDCLCCINLNLSFIDLGGPGCVKFNYVPANDSMIVNMSYGERLLETNTLKRTSTKPTCMDLFSDLAQMCAKFSDLSRVSKGIKGCLSVEPFLLGISQANYHVGCFDMDVQGVQPHIKPTTTPHAASFNNTRKPTEKPEENEEEELAAAISQSAEEGIAWFNNFIATVFGSDSNDTVPSTESVEPLHNRTHATVKFK